MFRQEVQSKVFISIPHFYSLPDFVHIARTIPVHAPVEVLSIIPLAFDEGFTTVGANLDDFRRVFHLQITSSAFSSADTLNNSPNLVAQSWQNMFYRYKPNLECNEV